MNPTSSNLSESIFFMGKQTKYIKHKKDTIKVVRKYTRSVQRKDNPKKEANDLKEPTNPKKINYISSMLKNPIKFYLYPRYRHWTKTKNYK